MTSKTKKVRRIKNLFIKIVFRFGIFVTMKSFQLLRNCFLKEKKKLFLLKERKKESFLQQKVNFPFVSTRRRLKTLECGEDLENRVVF